MLTDVFSVTLYNKGTFLLSLWKLSECIDQIDTAANTFLHILPNTEINFISKATLV